MESRSMAAMFGDQDIHSILTNCSLSTSVNYLIWVVSYNNMSMWKHVGKIGCNKLTITKIIQDWNKRATVYSTYVICKTGRRPAGSLVGFYTEVLSRYFTK